MNDDSKSPLDIALEAMRAGEEEARRSITEQLRVLRIEAGKAKPLARPDFLPEGWRVVQGGRKD